MLDGESLEAGCRRTIYHTYVVSLNYIDVATTQTTPAHAETDLRNN